jgi:hypothetical protein
VGVVCRVDTQPPVTVEVEQHAEVDPEECVQKLVADKHIQEDSEGSDQKRQVAVVFGWAKARQDTDKLAKKNTEQQRDKAKTERARLREDRDDVVARSVVGVGVGVAEEQFAPVGAVLSDADPVEWLGSRGGR